MRNGSILVAALPLMLIVLANQAAMANTDTTEIAFFTSQYDAGTNPFHVAIGDLDNDTVPDLAVANSRMWECMEEPCESDVSVLLGNGNGTFRTAVNYDVGKTPLWVAIDDLNEDENADLVVSNSDSDTVSVLLGNGDGSFQDAVDYAVTEPHSVTIGDLNGDGRPDLAVANYHHSSKCVFVLLGNGDGTFQPAKGYSDGGGWRSHVVAIGDLNEDEKPDLAVSRLDELAVSVFLGNGDGTFEAGVQYPTGGLSGSVDIGDLNGDDHLDLAVGLSGAPHVVAILAGNGDGTFETAVHYDTGSSAWSAVIGDLDGDGKPDLALTETGTPKLAYLDQGLGVLLGNGDGSFQSPDLYYSSYYYKPRRLALGDLNGDNRQDVVMAYSGYDHPGSGTGIGGITVFRNLGPTTTPPCGPASLVGAETTENPRSLSSLVLLLIPLGAILLMIRKLG